ncbi:MAG: hypothetical protein FI708_05315 [SAR202 cluster bacterium]|nr:hypothetical protein [Dehalococcoidia bacterium]MQG62139.1 hypothetical protein [SAR202 cluster bacterium]MQG65083.1 hypothetical protein [SAR202 cluster bacterium]|tara:strand:- start:898 stop:1305 length:408 start_codon:yes stop_codon:yes gene_type:complete
MSTQDASGAVNLERQFTEIVDQYSDLAYSVAFRLLQKTADAEDGVQETYIPAFKTLHLAIPHRRQRLFRIPKDESRAKYISENLFDDALVCDWENDPEEAAVNSELSSTLEPRLDISSPDLRTAVVLRDTPRKRP